jgi:hypothetical protein
MKKKIVYISGAEVFDINDVRAAFDEVRSALNLGNDTILFGVPVDESATQTDEVNTESVVDDTVLDVEPNQEPECVEEPDEIAEEVPLYQEEAEAPVEDVVVANSNVAENDAPVVPIQSVLTSETKKGKGRKKSTAKKVVVEEEPVAVAEPKAEDNVEVAEEKAAEPVAETTISVQEVEIENIINDDMPTEPKEKTLEELLESMTPLCEDVRPDVIQEPVAESQNVDEIDATLESLANEFADTQAKTPAGKKNAGRSKIGKLKSILPLPFSKKNKDDTGIMGDLFGWAGFAANDDDFTMPGFFANAGGKK